MSNGVISCPFLNERQKVFRKVEVVLWTVMEILFLKQQQTEGKVRKFHNFLSIDDVRKLYSSPELSETLPRSFQYLLVFGVAIITSMRPTEFSLLQTTQIRNPIISGKRAFKISDNMGAKDVTCKNAKGGIFQVKGTPKEIAIFALWKLDGKATIYKYIEKYMDVRLSIMLAEDKNNSFFTTINGNSI